MKFNKSIFLPYRIETIFKQSGVIIVSLLIREAGILVKIFVVEDDSKLNNFVVNALNNKTNYSSASVRY